jgi:hypothetical protein
MATALSAASLSMGLGEHSELAWVEQDPLAPP